jgi:hypothetical protein
VKKKVTFEIPDLETRLRNIEERVKNIEPTGTVVRLRGGKNSKGEEYVRVRALGNKSGSKQPASND